MMWNVILTHDCNKNCSYCLSQEADVPFPRKIAYSLSDLKQFLLKDSDEKVGIAFYGGEPLLAMDMMECMMDEMPANQFVIQTNGTLLDRIKDKYLSKLTTILLSIDGPETTTDHYRGKGTHDLVMGNARLIRTKGYVGELTARMCISEQSDVYRDVSYLLGARDSSDGLLFDGIHWQNDLMFGDRDDWQDLDGWLVKSYYPGVKKLMEDWVNQMEISGLVRLIYPFVGLTKTMLSCIPAKLHCGCGHYNNNICTDGRITACPVSSDFYPIFQLGNIFDNEPADFYDAMLPGDPCPSCDVHDVCGGRCLYANKIKPWGEEGYAKVCETVRHLIRTVEAYLPRIKILLDSGKIKTSQFNYFQYNGCEIIP